MQLLAACARACGCSDGSGPVRLSGPDRPRRRRRRGWAGAATGMTAPTGARPASRQPRTTRSSPRARPSSPPPTPRSAASISAAPLSITGRTLTVGTTATSKLAATVLLTGGNLRLDGATTWSAGSVQIVDAGLFETAGALQATGPVAVEAYNGGGTAGRRALHVLRGRHGRGLGQRCRSLSELENDGTLRALTGGVLTQYNEVATPADSSGAFVADNTGVLSLSNVRDGRRGRARRGRARSASPAGSAGSRRARTTPPGSPRSATTGRSTSTPTPSTDALRMTGGARRGTGTLTVGNGQSSLAQATFTDPGLTSFTGGQTAITGTVLLNGGSHTVRLGGTTTWSTGSVADHRCGAAGGRGPAADHGHGRGGDLQRSAGRSAGARFTCWRAGRPRSRAACRSCLSSRTTGRCARSPVAC